MEPTHASESTVSWPFMPDDMPEELIPGTPYHVRRLESTPMSAAAQSFKPDREPADRVAEELIPPSQLADPVPQIPQVVDLPQAPIRSAAREFTVLDISQHRNNLIGIVDIETTDLNKHVGMIIEIGVAALDVVTGEVFELFNSMCREPEKAVPDNAYIYKISDIRPDMILAAPPLEEIRCEVQEALNLTAANTAYNKKFDFPYLKSRGFDPGPELPCPMVESTNICCIPNKYGNWKWPKVEEAWQFYFPDQPYVELHRGLDDAMHEAKIVYEMIQRGIIRIEGL